jgi:hypothetical protein
VSFRNLDNPPTGAPVPTPGALAALLGAVIDWLAKLRDVVNNIMRGKINATLDVTLTVSAASTMVSDARIGGSCGIYLMPLSANAAAEIGNGTIWWSAPGNQTVTLNHANNAQADRIFRLLIIG